LPTEYQLVDPDSKLDFTHDWSDWLVGGNTITARKWTITPQEGSPGMPLLIGDTNATVFVQGCKPGMVYRLVERVTTSGGAVDDRTIVLRCDQS
jgi:hypothetical protein